MDHHDQVSQLCDAVERMRNALNSQSNSSKLSVAFPVFTGDESEDVREFVDNYKRAARLNGWSDINLALGFPLYLKGHASAWFKTLQDADEMSFNDLADALIRHFASRASEWRIRQLLGQRRQLRTHCARLNLPRTEWTHCFVQGLKPEIREYVILQQPENLEVAENFAKLKESVLNNSEKAPVFDAKQMSAQIIEELSKIVSPKEEIISAVGHHGSDINKSDIKEMIHSEFQQLMGSAAPTDRSRQRRSPYFQSRGFRSRTGVPTCFNCGKKGHTYYHCRAKPEPRVPRYNRDRQNNYSRQQQAQNSFDWNTNQGN